MDGDAGDGLGHRSDAKEGLGLHDLGIGVLPDYVVEDFPDIQRVLPDVESKEVPVFLAYPEELRQSRRISAFRDFVTEEVIAYRRRRKEAAASGTSYTVRVNGVEDLAGNPIAANTTLAIFEPGEVIIYINEIMQNPNELFDSEGVAMVNTLKLGSKGLQDAARDAERLAAVAQTYPLDAVEITTKGFRNREFEVPEIAYPKIASDDSHTRLGIGRAWIEMDAGRSKDAILRAVKHDDFWNCYL